MSVLELAQQVLSQAKKINNAAKEKDWAAIEQLQGSYIDTVNRIAIAEVTEAEAPTIRNLLIEARKLNRDAEQLADQFKTSLVKEKQTLSKANKMQKALDALK
ncbi:hypothetical protein [Neptuniibacter sp.]|uniref:hypothetical protein n=1 Tax=Neptuniibacter sp. TaxID=1962643 RepID=UPI003B5CEAF4